MRCTQSMLGSVQNFYHENGYYIFKGAISLATLDTLKKALHNLLSHGDARRQSMSLTDLILDVESEDHAKVYNAMISMGSSVAAYDLIHELDIGGKTEIFSEISFESIHGMLLQTPIQLPQDERFDFNWHQENGSYSILKNTFTFWFPVLSHARKETGTVEIIPGTHKNGERPSKHIVKPGGLNDWIVDVTDAELANAISIEIDLGDVVFFDANLIHRTIPNRSKQPRVTGIVRTVNLIETNCIRPISKAVNYNDLTIA